MIKTAFENLLLFLLPTLLYVGYVLLTRNEATSQAAGKAGPSHGLLEDAPLLWLFVAGAILVIVTLVTFGSTSGGKPGQHYEPSSLKDGRIEPGHIE